MAGGGGPGTIVQIVDGDTTVATWRLPGRGRLDLGLVDALARLHLAARRQGWTVNLAEVDPELDALLGFTGLAEVLGGVLPLAPGWAGDRGPRRPPGRGSCTKWRSAHLRPR